MSIVTLIGRPNVGKSTLFNRIVGKRIATVEETPGVTRDRNDAPAEWGGHTFTLVDTGGFMSRTEGTLEAAVQEQTEIAIDTADLLVLMIDGREPMTSDDFRLVERLRKCRDKVLVAINKAENPLTFAESFARWDLGLGDVFPISSQNGTGVAELLDELVKHLPPEAPEPEGDVIRVAIIGRPNVGKSSLMNRILGETRAVVSEIAGTTRDPIHTTIERDGHQYMLIDTAGLRRKYRQNEGIEYYTVLRTLRALDQASVAVVMLDATQGLTVADQKVVELAEDAYKGLVIAINKWDLFEKDQGSADQIREWLTTNTRFARWAPIVFISALTGQRVNKLFEAITEVHSQRTRRISTSEFNSFLQAAQAKRFPPAIDGRYLKLFYGTQIGIDPPSFVIFANHPELLPTSYVNFLTNQFRETFGFDGTPIKLAFRPRRKEEVAA